MRGHGYFFLTVISVYVFYFSCQQPAPTGEEDEWMRLVARESEILQLKSVEIVDVNMNVY